MPCSPDALLPADQTPPKSPRYRWSRHCRRHECRRRRLQDDRSTAAVGADPDHVPRPRGAGWKDAGDADEEEELSESYTCVIAHVAGSKRVYFDDGYDGVRYNHGASPGVFFQSPPAIKAVEFINRCYLCAKKLHGLDIFVYRGDKAFCSLECRCQQFLSCRGDKAFCSLECRCQQFLSDEYRENYNSGALEQLNTSLCLPFSSLLVLQRPNNLMKKRWQRNK